jgi:hypothetical protein
MSAQQLQLHYQIGCCLAKVLGLKPGMRNRCMHAGHVTSVDRVQNTHRQIAATAQQLVRRAVNLQPSQTQQKA